MMSSFDSGRSQLDLAGKRVTQEWERKFVNISMLLREKTKRRKLSKLYLDQTTSNEHLRDENDSLQSQQRALIRLLQEKDTRLQQCSKSNPKRHLSVERFVTRFSRDIDDPGFIGEQHLLLRKLVLNKLKHLHDIFIRWRREAQIEGLKESIEESRETVVRKLVLRSLNSIALIRHNLTLRIKAQAMKKIALYE